MTHGRKPIPREPDAEAAPFDAAFGPAPVRDRHDGWTPDKQVAFIEALAESGCVAEACKRVGMSHTAAYRLRRRIDAQSFRNAWDLALDYAVRRLSDAAFARALHGTVRPVFYQGEQIGERRYFDERLTMFVLRYRDPVRYGAWRDRMEHEQHPDGAALALSLSIDRVAEHAWEDALGVRRSRPRAGGGAPDAAPGTPDAADDDTLLDGMDDAGMSPGDPCDWRTHLGEAK